MILTFEKFLEIKEDCSARVNLLSAALNSFPKEFNGMVSEKFRTHESFVKMKKNFQAEFKRLREINSYGNKFFKKELRAKRDSERKYNLIKGKK
jgi:hypothetical protein